MQERYLNTTFNDDGLKLEGNSLIDFLQGHDKAIIGLEEFNESILKELPDLKLISKYGVGLDMIDIQAMKKYGKKLGWSGGVNSRSVSELVISLAISLLRHTFEANNEVISGVWKQRVGRYLSGCTVGIIGFGFIGKDLVKLLKPFNCKILAYDIKDYSDFYVEHDVTSTSLDELLEISDVVTLHLPLDDSTTNILNEEKLTSLWNGTRHLNQLRKLNTHFFTSNSLLNGLRTNALTHRNVQMERCSTSLS